MAKLFHSMIPTSHEFFEGTPEQAIGAVLRKWIADGRARTEATLKDIDDGRWSKGDFSAEFIAQRRAECVRILENRPEDVSKWTIIPTDDGFMIHPVDIPLPQETFLLLGDDFEFDLN